MAASLTELAYRTLPPRKRRKLMHERPDVAYGLEKTSALRISKAYTNARRSRPYNVKASPVIPPRPPLATAARRGICNDKVALTSSATKKTIVACILNKLLGERVGDDGLNYRVLMGFLTGTNSLHALRPVVYGEDGTVESVMERNDVDAYELTDMVLSPAAIRNILMAWPKKHLQVMYKMWVPLVEIYE